MRRIREFTGNSFPVFILAKHNIRSLNLGKILEFYRFKVLTLFAYMARFSKKAQKVVRQVMHRFKRGGLKSGRARKPVHSRRQAIAIGISEARKRGERVPARKR